jgi:hypothetical protein
LPDSTDIFLPLLLDLLSKVSKRQIKWANRTLGSSFNSPRSSISYKKSSLTSKAAWSSINIESVVTTKSRFGSWTPWFDSQLCYLQDNYLNLICLFFNLPHGYDYRIAFLLGLVSQRIMYIKFLEWFLTCSKCLIHVHFQPNQPPHFKR